MSERFVDTSIIEPTVKPQAKESSISFVVAENQLPPKLDAWHFPLFPNMNSDSHSDHLHYIRLINPEIRWFTKENLTPEQYFPALREFIDNAEPEREHSLFEGWDFHKYLVYYITRTASENRNSVRNNWEAMGKGLHKAEWYEQERGNPEKNRKKYRELENDTIYREGM